VIGCEFMGSNFEGKHQRQTTKTVARVSRAKAESKAARARVDNSLVSAQASSKISRTKGGSPSVALVATAAGIKMIKVVRAVGIASIWGVHNKE
jgi:hypothetical protein